MTALITPQGTRRIYQILVGWIWPLVTVVLLGMLGACTQPHPDSLRFGLSSAPVNLDPRYATDAASARINRLLYRRLVDFDDSIQPVPSLATWQRLSPLHYRFHLGDQGRRFHDGSLLTSEDVRATYWSILNDNPVSPHRSTLSLIRGIKTLGEDTIDFYLSRPDPLFPAYMVIGILPARSMAAKHPFQQQPLGSGNFRFLDWPQPEHLRLTRQTDGQVFEFLRVADPTVRVLKLLRGEIDMLQNDLPTELVSYLEEQDGIRMMQGDGNNFTYLGFNLDDPVVGRLAVRKAIAYAIDREALIRYVLGGAARVAGSLLPPEHWAGHPTLTGYPYDPARARAIVAKRESAGLPALRISYKTSSDPVRIRLATILQHQFQKVGIQIKLQSYDWGTFYGDIKQGRFQMYSLSWVGIKTPDIFHYIFHSASIPPAAANRGRFKDPVVDQLLEAVKITDSLEQQVNLFHRIQQRLSEQLPYIPLWYEEHVFACRDNVLGYRLASDGNYDGLLAVHRKRSLGSPRTRKSMGIKGAGPTMAK